MAQPEQLEEAARKLDNAGWPGDAAHVRSVIARPVEPGVIEPERIAEWRREQANPSMGGMVSAIGEYTPDEFWELLDAYEALVRSGASLQGEGRVADLELALQLALGYLVADEPGDSRLVSNEFVAMAVIQANGDRLDECREIVRAALKAIGGDRG